MLPVYLFRKEYYWGLNAVNAVLAEHPEIDRVWLSINPDVTLEVEGVYFSIVGQPNVIFHSDGIDGTTQEEFRERLERALRERHPVPRPEYATEYWR
jgi:hypothetical protein